MNEVCKSYLVVESIGSSTAAISFSIGTITSISILYYPFNIYRIYEYFTLDTFSSFFISSSLIQKKSIAQDYLFCIVYQFFNTSFIIFLNSMKM